MKEDMNSNEYCALCGAPSYGMPHCGDCYHELKAEGEEPSQNTQVIARIIAFIVIALIWVGILREGNKMEEDFRRSSHRIEMMMQGRLNAPETQEAYTSAPRRKNSAARQRSKNRTQATKAFNHPGRQHPGR